MSAVLKGDMLRQLLQEAESGRAAMDVIRQEGEHHHVPKRNLSGEKPGLAIDRAIKTHKSQLLVERSRLEMVAHIDLNKPVADAMENLAVLIAERASR